VALFRGAEMTGLASGPTPAASGLAIKASPNPASRMVTVTLPAAVPQSSSPAVSLYDMQGRLICSHPASAASVSFDVSTLPAGVYLCRFQDGRYSAAQQLVISR
jgi:hypothetical protein